MKRIVVPPPETTKTPSVSGSGGPSHGTFDVLAGRRADPDRDQRLHLAAERGQVGLGVIAADHAALA